MDQPKLLIVGAGPTGLVLALWLTRMGLPVRIIDRAPGPGTTSRATVIHARNLEFYHQLGIDQIAISGGLELKTLNLWIRGKKATHAPVADFGKGMSPYPYILIFPQDKQEQMLTNELNKSGVGIEWNTELISFEHDEQGIRGEIRKNNQTESFGCLYLAGCDGAHSTVRRQMEVGFEGGTYEHTFYVADIKASGPAANGEMHAAFDDADFMIIFPMKGDTNIRLVGSVGSQHENNSDLKWEDVSKNILTRLKMDVEKINWFSTYRVHHRVASRFRQQHVFLLGDAAHLHSPVGGQGMNTGIGDAVNLAWKLAGVLQGSAHERLLDSYEMERIPFARKLVSTTDRAFTLATTRTSLATLVRLRLVPLLLPILFRLASLKRSMFRTVSQIAIKYPQSFLSAGQAGRIKGGDRLPWVTMANAGDSNAGNFESLRGMQWQVHCYGKMSSKLQDFFTDKMIPLFIFEWSAAAKKAGYLENAIYIVRPDGYVGLADPQEDFERLSTYTNQYIQPNKNTPMEVHHHPDLEHKKKNFREYFLEFLMIFLAVSLGFIAENLREHISDSNKEKEYIESMLQDLKSDTARANHSITGTTRQIHGMDTLEMLLTPDVNANDSAVFICYRQSESLYDEYTMNFSSRTITQLFSSGNMRLIKNQSVSDRISAYYAAIRDVDAQKAHYKEYFEKCLAIYPELFEFESYHKRFNVEDSLVNPPLAFGKYRINNTNAENLKKIKPTLDITKAVIASYRSDIKLLKAQAESLFLFLKEKYKLEDH
jgi:2-polyprenyl-6-methoxyphenol hydroxylase-like FAD-dependent oxidoreductase